MLYDILSICHVHLEPSELGLIFLIVYILYQLLASLSTILSIILAKFLND